MNAKFFDVIVLGENLAGLIAASLLASRKYSVLLIRKFAGPGRDTVVGQAVRRRWTMFPGIFDHPAPTAVIRELNLGHKFRSVFKSSSPLFQIVGPRNRTTIHEDRSKLVAELRREFSDLTTGEEIQTFFARLDEFNSLMDHFLVPGLNFHPDGIKERWTQSGKVKEFEKSVEAADALVGDLGRFWRDSPLGWNMDLINHVAADAGQGYDLRFAYRRAYDLFREMLYQVAGEGIDEILLEFMDRRSVRVLDQTAITEIATGRGGYQFFDAKNSYGGESIVCAFDYFLLPELWRDRKIEKFLQKQLGRVRPGRVWIKQSYILERDVIPEGMGHTVFLLPESGRDDLLVLHRDPLTPEDAEVERLDVNQLIPIGRFNEDGLKEIQEQTIDRIRDFIPFLDGKLRKIYLEQTVKPDSAMTHLAGRRLSYDASDDALFRGVPYCLPLDHVYLAGPEVAPELGLEGEFLTGWAIARQVCARKPKKDDLR